jgi:hypothetical protein
MDDAVKVPAPPPEPPESAQEPPAPAKPPRPPVSPMRKLTLIVLLVAVVLFVYGLFADRSTPYTDQGAVQSSVIMIAPDVSGPRHKHRRSRQSARPGRRRSVRHRR